MTFFAGLCRKVAEEQSAVFTADKTHNLMVRLRHNVIRTGLRRINLAYSRISLADVAKKLGLLPEISLNMLSHNINVLHQVLRALV